MKVHGYCEAKVGKVHIAASTEAELADAVRAVKANEPMLAQFVRRKGGAVLGFISGIDKESGRIQVNESPSWHRWSDLEYA